MRSRVSCGGAALVTLVVGGCGSLSAPVTVRDGFAQSTYCPAERVTVTPRGFAPGVAPTPPANVAGDPARLKLWKDQHPQGQSKALYEVEGCGQRAVYACRHGSSNANDPEYCDTGTSQFCCDQMSPNAAPP
jgi:hypothetical protein